MPGLKTRPARVELPAMAWLILLIVAWGALAFGSVYDWARWPLLAGCVFAGAWGFARRVPHERRPIIAPVLAGLVLVAAAVCVQLVPLDSHTVRRWSPATHQFLMQYDLRYALPTVEEISPGSKDPSSTSRTFTLPDEPRLNIPFSGSITHPLSIDPPRTWVGLACLAAFGFMLLGLAHGIGGHGLRILAPGIVALGFLLSMIGIVQKALWTGKVYGFWEPINKGVVAFGPFINRNHFAGWMLMALPVAAGYFASQVARGMVGVKPGWRNRIVWFSTPDASRAVLTGFAILIMGFALALTLSRSGIGCFLLAMVLSAFNVLRRQAGTTRGRLLGTYMVLVFVTAVAWAGIDAIGARFADVDWELGGRAGAWADAWRIHRMFPWFGTGLNTYGSATLLLQEFEKTTAHYIEAHNDYLQLLVEGGWMVAVPALLLIGLFAREVRRRFREALDDRTGYWLRLGAVTGIVAIAFQEIVEFSLQMPGNAALFTVLCAMAVRRASVKRAPSASVSRPASSA
jgi:O-antigen ligase